ncbi:MAG: DUF3791 domain-containing protein [Paludibacteraceae bacterium]|nr:DUF3791 domain-containing protein [Paludibacteraceae bacterium]
MNKKNQDITYFISFCVEQYKHVKHLDVECVMALFSEFGVLDYLNEHFEILHTQNQHWIIEEIDEFIELRKKEQL